MFTDAHTLYNHIRIIVNRWTFCTFGFNTHENKHIHNVEPIVIFVNLLSLGGPLPNILV
jgi:hypothetical protein